MEKLELDFGIKAFKREIIVAFNIYEKIKIKYPNREVIPCSYIDSNEFYYFFKGQVRRVNVLDSSICVVDYDRGFPWMKRIR